MKTIPIAIGASLILLAAIPDANALEVKSKGPLLNDPGREQELPALSSSTC